MPRSRGDQVTWANDTAIASTWIIREDETELFVLIFFGHRPPCHQVVRIWHDLSPFVDLRVQLACLRLIGAENIVAFTRFKDIDSVREN